MFWLWLLKNWQGMLSGGAVVAVLLGMVIGGQRTQIGVLQGQVARLEGKADGFEKKLETEKELRAVDRIACQEIADDLADSETTVRKWIDAVRLEEMARAEDARISAAEIEMEREDRATETLRAVTAVNRAVTCEDKMTAIVLEFRGGG